MRTGCAQETCGMCHGMDQEGDQTFSAMTGDLLRMKGWLTDLASPMLQWKAPDILETGIQHSGG